MMIKPHYITAICKTNLDDFQKETWPKLFVEIPQIGHSIKGRSGKILKVVNITHANEWAFDNRPLIIIELGLGYQK